MGGEKEARGPGDTEARCDTENQEDQREQEELEGGSG